MNQPENGLPTAEQVENYLRQHPEFFTHHLKLLESITIPHPSGNAVSLISKQLEIFRSKHQELENQLIDLIEVARDNDAAINRMHRLTLALMEATDLEQAVGNLNQVFFEYFRTDFVAMRIISGKSHDALADLFIAPDAPELEHFQQILKNNQPKCGRPTLGQAQAMFYEVAADVKSCAVIPMAYAEFKGLIVLGSTEPKRFHHSLGNLYLIQMGEIIGTRLAALLQLEMHED
ncbi:MAG: DUF484 family protein [Gammaproteobacteria bacterium]